MAAVSIFWFRRDLRLNDNAGLYSALKTSENVQPIFIFDTNILDKLEDKDDARVQFIHDTIIDLDHQLQEFGCRLHVYYGKPLEVMTEIMSISEVTSVFTNRDYEPYALDRDDKVANLCLQKGITFSTYKDHVIFEKDEVLKKDNGPYTVFSPYKRRWLEKVKSKINTKGNSFYYKAYPTLKYAKSFAKSKPRKIVSLSHMGFKKSTRSIPSKEVPQKIVKLYDKQRNFPAIRGTTMLGIHFRFGTISIREKARKAEKLNETYLSELIWRDFYSQILSHFPHVVDKAFRAKYEKLEFRNNEREFAAWCQGLTGFPIVDAGMRELNATGYMHNRVRMVVASFLTKHLLIDWRWGEAYFAAKLLDFDLASNNGGWQWASGSGTDAAPYFRIFNPTSQMTKFDKDLVYIKKWIPEYGSDEYPEPIVDHKMARERCLAMYKRCLS